MRLYEVVKVFDLADAPLELRESFDLAILRPSAREDCSTILSLRVGHYDSDIDNQINGPSSREITYTEFQLHRWLLEHGAQDGEDVFLRWKSAAPVRPHYMDHWSKRSEQPGSVTILRRPISSCD